LEDNYYIDLKKISLSAYADELAHTELIPSRRIIQEDIPQRFACLARHGVANLADLLNALKTSGKIIAFAEKTGLPEEYLAILKREISSNQPKPVAIKDFPGIPADAVQKLEALRITNTKQLFDHVKTPESRQSLARKTALPPEVILELTKLTDVVRIKWVGANFARLLVDSGCDTVEKVTGADYAQVYHQLMKINEEKQYFKGKFGLNDMKLCVLAAKSVPLAIQY